MQRIDNRWTGTSERGGAERVREREKKRRRTRGGDEEEVKRK